MLGLSFSSIRDIFRTGHTDDMTDLRGSLARLAVPIFIEVLLVMMLGAVDTFMLSR